MHEIKGLRRPDDTPLGDLRPGEYAHRTDIDPPRWEICVPTGDAWVLDDRWMVTEHEDHTISVNPSLAVGPKDAYRYHGWLRKGYWTEVTWS
jgi:hypothetical protein